MKWMLLALGFVFGMIGGVGGALYLVEKSRNAQDSGLLFPPKNFIETEDFVGMSGSVTSPGLLYPTNTATIDCYRNRKECWFASIKQTRPNLIEPIDGPKEYDITEWTTDRVTAFADGALDCMRTTITLDRKAKEVSWIDEPVNLSQPQCQRSNIQAQIRRYSMGNPAVGPRLPPKSP
jgi:hypothetical protein